MTKQSGDQTTPPWKLLKIPDFQTGSVSLNIELYAEAAKQLDSHEQPLIPAWSMREKSCRLAEWNYLLGKWDACLEWSERAAQASLECLRLTITHPLPQDYATNDDYAFAPYGIMVDDRAALRAREWVHFFESGMHWAVVGSHDAITKQIGELPLDQIPTDRFNADYDQLKYAFCLALQTYCRGEDSLAAFRENASREEKDSWIRHLSSSMLAIIAGDDEGYATSFESALRSHCQKGEYQSWGVPIPVFPSLATTVWHLAEQQQMYPKLPPHLQAYLFILKGMESVGPAKRSEQIAMRVPKPTTPADRLGLMAQDFQSDIALFKKAKAKFEQGDRLIDMAWLMASSSQSVAVTSFLRGDSVTFQEWCVLQCAATENYLMGNWQSAVPLDDGTIDPIKHRYGTGSWGQYLEEGLAWAAIGDHWEGVSTLLEYPDERMQPPEGGEGFRLYYLGLAKWWKTPEDLSWTEGVKSKKGAVQLAEQIEAIAEKDEKKFAKAMNKYVTAFLKRKHRGDYEFPHKAIFSWHLARRAGMKPKITPKNRLYLFELPSE